MNKLISIGFLGDNTVYLNLSREEAVNRFATSRDMSPEKVVEDYRVQEFEFSDTFYAYDVWASE